MSDPRRAGEVVVWFGVVIIAALGALFLPALCGFLGAALGLAGR